MNVPYGRLPIYTDYEFVDESNIVEVLTNALSVHSSNQADIKYLYEFYKGKQPIVNRKKTIRPEINNKVVENRAYEIVSFKVGYLMGEPIQYVKRSADFEDEPIAELNDEMYLENKAVKDKKLVWWSTICGTSFRMTLPNQNDTDDEAPFNIYTLDPYNTFVVYWSGLGNKPVLSCNIIQRTDGQLVYYCYTDTDFYIVTNNEVVSAEPHIMGYNPITEYPANFARLGAFEIVHDMLNAINVLSSNRLDGIEQFVQSLLVFIGADIDSEKFAALREQGGIKIPDGTDVKYLVQELNQAQTQTLVDYMYQTVLTICGMPNRNGGSSTSDTGVAVHIRDGWEAAENRAKDSEGLFIMSEKEFLKIVRRISSIYGKNDFKLSSVEVRFTRRNYENILEKSQVLTTMLNDDSIHPLLAFEHCGMFVDPQSAYEMSEEWKRIATEKQQAELDALTMARSEVNV